MEKQTKISLHIAQLIGEHLDGRDKLLSKELREWLETSARNRELFDELVNGSALSSRLEFYESIDFEAEWSAFQQKRGKKVSRLFIHRWQWVAGVAAIFVVCCISVCFLFNKTSKSSIYTPFTGENIMPGKSQAILSTNGHQILLGQSKKVTTKNGIISVTDSLGNEIYQANPSPVEMNQLYVPQGGEYYIVLEDGTHVWLNSDTKLEFPSHFDKDKRKITIHGEAYLEVAHNPEKPFYVETGGSTIHVTGTAFNVRNYSDEQTSSVALVQGRVQIEDTDNGGILAVLTPSKKFVIGHNSGKYSVETANLELDLAWRKGMFAFENESLSSIARMLERWYNIKIDIDPAIAANRYSGFINRHKSISQIVDILQRTNELRFVSNAEGQVKILPAQ
jgi:transmembrane sensor